MLAPLSVVDTRSFFRPVSSSLVALLNGLTDEQWNRRTVAGAWTVRDVLAHLIDVAFRRVSFDRDRLVPPPPPYPIQNDRDFARFINGLNHEWVNAAKRFSPQVLAELFALGSEDLASFIEARPLEGPGLFGVSWAGEQESAAWFDVGREFTELWHHQMQIRMAVGAEPLADPRYLKAVLELSVRALPHAYRDVAGPKGQTVTLDVTGASGGIWTLTREANGWLMLAGAPEGSDARVTMTDDVAWRVFYNALPPTQANAEIMVEGQANLAVPLIRARSIVI
jgi:uncharacterized protein (TIGR03083 family)